MRPTLGAYQRSDFTGVRRVPQLSRATLSVPAPASSRLAASISHPTGFCLDPLHLSEHGRAPPAVDKALDRPGERTKGILAGLRQAPEVVEVDEHHHWLAASPLEEFAGQPLLPAGVGRWQQRGPSGPTCKDLKSASLFMSRFLGLGPMVRDVGRPALPSTPCLTSASAGAAGRSRGRAVRSSTQRRAAPGDSPGTEAAATRWPVWGVPSWQCVIGRIVGVITGSTPEHASQSLA
jgi:hypothetical protein